MMERMPSAEHRLRVLQGQQRELQDQLAAARKGLSLLQHRLRVLEQKYRLLQEERLGSSITLQSGATIDSNLRTISHGGRTEQFPPQQWALVEALAIARRPLRRDEVATALWQGICSPHAASRLFTRTRERFARLGAGDDLVDQRDPTTQEPGRYLLRVQDQEAPRAAD